MHYGKFIVLVVTATVVSALPANNETLKFTVKDWGNPMLPQFKRKFIFQHTRFVFDCTTNDPDASVKLLERPPFSQGQYKDSLSVKGSRLQKSGQTFILDRALTVDAQDYQCSASNKRDGDIELALGTLMVHAWSVEDVIEIYPYYEAGLEVHKGSNQKISCKAFGAVGTDPNSAFLKWFRLVNGKLVELTNVAHKDEIINTNTVDIVEYEFKDFKKEDEGVYFCRRKLGTDLKYENITISMKALAKPTVSFPSHPSGFVSQPSGSDVRVYCQVVGSPLPDKFWRKNGKIFLPCPLKQQSDCYLEMNNVKWTNSGEYYCGGKNSEGETYEKFTIEITEPPVIEKPTHTVLAIYEESKLLTCRITIGNPPPRISWEYQVDTCEASNKDCKPLDGEWKPVADQTPEKDKPTKLSTIVAKPTRRNYFYRCKAANKVGSDIYTFTVARAAKSEAQFSFYAEANPINEDSRLNISCVIDATKFKTPIITRLGSTTPLKVTKEVDGNNIETYTYWKPNGELSDAGVYLCTADNQRGTSVSNGTIEIIVKKLVKPKITNFNDLTISQDEYRNLTINCETEGNPKPTITWQFNGRSLDKIPKINNVNQCQSLKDGIYQEKENVLIICGLNYQDHAGEFRCTSRNVLDTAIKTMKLTVQAKPKIKGLAKEKTFGIGDGGEIYCNTLANPPANVTWEFFSSDNDTIQMTSGTLEIGVLTFPKLETKNAGTYICKATNKHGSVEQSITVYVKGTKGSASFAEEQKGTIIGLVVAFVIILIIIIIFVLWYRRHLKTKYAKYLQPDENFVLDPDRTLFDQSNDLPYDMAWEFPRERLTFIKTLGSGAFGQVWLAEAEGLHGFKPRVNTPDARKRRKSIQKSRRYHTMSFRYKKQGNVQEVSLEKMMVAVKTLKEDAAEGEYKDLASELKILIHLGEHKNIVNLLGACTTNGKLCVILECCPHGSLLNFLRNKRDIFQGIWAKYETDMEKECTYIDLAMTAWQVARGMDFLQSKKLVHRDLAARNVLVGEDFVMKIADFGLARDIYKDEFYLKQTTGLLPVKWMAPESLFDRVYTTSSDVWSYGILLWEIFTLGGSPYPGLPTEDLHNYLEDGKRMDCPDRCPKDIYEIMSDCWTKSPYERPLFAQIAERLNNVMKQNIPSGNSQYLDFTDAKDDYLQPDKPSQPSEYLVAAGANDMSHEEENSKQPLLTSGHADYEDDFDNPTLQNSPLPPPPPPDDTPTERYIMHDPDEDEHYKVPKSNAELV